MTAAAGGTTIGPIAAIELLVGTAESAVQTGSERARSLASTGTDGRMLLQASLDPPERPSESLGLAAHGSLAAAGIHCPAATEIWDRPANLATGHIEMTPLRLALRGWTCPRDEVKAMVGVTAWEGAEETSMAAAAAAAHRAATDPRGIPGRGRATTATRAAMREEGSGGAKAASSPPPPTKTNGLVGSARALWLGEAVEVLLGVSERGSEVAPLGRRASANMAYFTSGGRRERRRKTRTQKKERR